MIKVAILTHKSIENVETFIQNHIKNLPFEKVVIYGGKLPYLADGYESTGLNKFFFKLKNKLRNSVGLDKKIFEEQRLKRILKKEKVDVVFAEFLFTGAESVSVCKELNIPLLAIALGYEISMYHMLETYKSKYKKLFEYASTIFVVSNHMKINLRALDCPDNKIVYTPAGPEDAFFGITPTFNSPTVLGVGRFVDKKAPHLTILAFKKVLDKIPEVKLVMAGDGFLWSACKDIVNYLEINDSVEFVGRITPAEHQKLLSEAYMFVQHSKVAEGGDSEGTPVAILEASAAQLPIVSTLHAGIPDVVKNNETGFLVPENNVDLMASKMIELLEDKNKAIAFGVAGKENVKNNFSLEKHINTLSLYIEKSVEVN